MSGTARNKRAPRPPVQPMRGVVFMFVLFVAIGAGIFIWIDRRAGPTQLEDEVPLAIRKPASPTVAKYRPKVTDAPFVMEVPFTSQAPFGNWDDPRQEDGCEEASALMAMRWRTGASITPADALDEILAMAAYEEDRYGTHNDTSAYDTVERIFKGYFNYHGAVVKYAITTEDIIKTLDGGKLVIVPAHGQKLGNPYFTPPGPVHHMLVITGYDMTTREFITNDPGTRRGEDFRYPMETLMAAITDYATGQGEPITGMEPTAMIVVSKIF